MVQREKFRVANREEEILGYRDLGSLALGELICTVAVWLENSLDEVLICQRSSNLIHEPGRWGPAVTGTVKMGEDYRETAVREMKEELGVIDVPIIEDSRVAYEQVAGGGIGIFCAWFRGETDLSTESLRLDRREVQNARWAPKNLLGRALADAPQQFVSTSYDWSDRFSLQTYARQ